MSLPVRNSYYLEVLEESELDFLEQKAGKQNRVYSIVAKIVFPASVALSFAGAWEQVEVKHGVFESHFSWFNYLVCLLAMWLLFSLGILLTRSLETHAVQKDLKQKLKVVERVLIVRKTFVPHNNTFHFYVNSRQKLSIEVSGQDFSLFSEGDEINIEYSKYAKIYFGYF